MPRVPLARITLEFRIRKMSDLLLLCNVHYNTQDLKVANLILLSKPLTTNLRRIWIKVLSRKNLIKFLIQHLTRSSIQQNGLKRMSLWVVILEIWILIFKLFNCWEAKRTSRAILIWTNRVCWKISEWWTSQTIIIQTTFKTTDRQSVKLQFKIHKKIKNHQFQKRRNKSTLCMTFLKIQCLYAAINTILSDQEWRIQEKTDCLLLIRKTIKLKQQSIGLSQRKEASQVHTLLTSNELKFILVFSAKDAYKWSASRLDFNYLSWRKSFQLWMIYIRK